MDNRTCGGIGSSGIAETYGCREKYVIKICVIGYFIVWKGYNYLRKNVPLCRILLS